MNQNQINISVDQTDPIKCDECGNQVFVERSLLRMVPMLLSPTGADSIMPIIVYSCSKCGHVNDEFIPTGIDSSEINKSSLQL